MKDWAGNEIKVGDTVVVVTTGNFCDDGEMNVSFISEDGDVHIIVDVPTKKTYSFIIGKKYLITEPTTMVVLSEREKSKVPINLINYCILKQPKQIICIEGLSDNREEYYKEYFK